MTIKEVRKIIDKWNNYHPEYKLVVEGYNGYYHLRDAEHFDKIATEKYPGRLFEMFTIWRSGYYAGSSK